jgi:hypothetical protein
VASAGERGDTSLESQAVAAHRAYIEALAAWERAYRAMSRPARRRESDDDESRALRCASAEAEKERRRVVFRDLCEALGYVPGGHGVALPPSGCPSRAG